MNRGAALHGGHDLQMIWKPAILIIALGISLIALQRWAMAIVVLGCTAIGVFLTVGPFFEIRKSLWESSGMSRDVTLKMQANLHIELWTS
jgi:hypothetical protein